MLSRGHAHLLNDDYDFCSRLISRSIRGAEEQPIDFLVAVVDGVSFPQGDLNGKGEELAMVARWRSFEGISVWISESEITAPELWSTAEDAVVSSEAKSTELCSLSFRFQNFGSNSQTLRLLQLSPSNTIFQNGQTSTMYAQRWMVRKTSSSGPELLISQPVRTFAQGLTLWRSGNGGTEYALEIPLEQLTTPRRIAVSFGNVISILESEEVSGVKSGVPASSELEKCVSNWLQTNDLANQQVHVWALVIPQELRADCVNGEITDLRRMLLSGSRLHKVLSGGGGWGPRKGLLALDPELDYHTGTRQATKDHQGFGEIVRPGNWIIFYVYDVWSHPDSKSTNSSGKSWYLRGPVSITFGTTPSTIDSLPGADGNGTSSPDVDCVYIRNHFGMMSERGMAMEIAALDNKPQKPENLGENDASNVFRMKLDPPNTQFHIRCRGPYFIEEISLGSTS